MGEGRSGGAGPRGDGGGGRLAVPPPASSLAAPLSLHPSLPPSLAPRRRGLGSRRLRSRARSPPGPSRSPGWRSGSLRPQQPWDPRPLARSVPPEAAGGLRELGAGSAWTPRATFGCLHTRRPPRSGAYLQRCFAGPGASSGDGTPEPRAWGKTRSAHGDRGLVETQSWNWKFMRPDVRLVCAGLSGRLDRSVLAARK